MAREVGAGDVSVDWLIELGKPSGDFYMTRHERERMAATDFTLCDSYRRTETWAAQDLAQRQNTGAVITADSLPVVSTVPPQGLLYLDPIIIRQYAGVIAEAFAKAQPEKGASFRGRAQRFVEQLDQLVANYPNSAFGDGKVVVLSTTYAPLLDRFAIESVLADRDAYRLTDADLAAIRKTARDSSATTVLVPFDLPPGAVNRVEDGTGLKAYAIDSVGYINFKGHDTYLALLQYDLAQLQLATAK